MGQKIRPTGFRTGIMIGWQSQWYAGKKDFSDLLVEDKKIRDFILNLLKKKRPMISKIKIDRTREKVIVTIYSGKVGVIIGKKGADIDKLTELSRRRLRNSSKNEQVSVAP
jgi:small subunit ribosomal protein S3